MKVDLTKIKFVHVLSSFVVLACFTYFFYYSGGMSKEQRSDSKEVLIAVIGVAGTVIGFWVGSSNSSSKKDEVIRDAISNQGQSPVRADNVENMNIGAGGTS